jgi:predicted DNA-binding protein
LNILNSQGLFGFIIYIALFAMVIYGSFKKGILENGLMQVITLLSLSLIFVGSIFHRYDFVLNFLYWFVLCIHLIILYEDEPREPLNISLGRDILGSNNKYIYIIPLVFIILEFLILAYSIPVLFEKYYLNQAKEAQIKNDRTAYLQNIQSAIQYFPSSALASWEYVNYEFENVLSEFIKLNDEVRSKPEFINSNEYKSRKSSLLSRTDNCLKILNILSRNQNFEYKNYYFAGLIHYQISSFNDFSLELNAEKSFLESLSRNTNNPSAYYYLASIYYRNNSMVNASNNITTAVRIFPDNILYLALQADILYKNGDYANALIIYEAIERFVNSNGTEQLTNIYKSEGIEQDIQNTKEKLEQKKLGK